jgi:GNAT superfamily N-acetyltransferase
VHTVTLWAADVAGEAAWHGLGYGRIVIDTVRDLAPPPAGRAVDVRRAGTGDAPVVAAFERALWEHLARAPTCRVHSEPEGVSASEARLSDPGSPVWLAVDGSEPIGSLSMEPQGDVPLALASGEIVRCDGAFTVPEARGRGVGAALFAAALEWAAAAGYRCCAVDFESANREASRFWPSMGCRPVLHSVARHLNG